MFAFSILAMVGLLVLIAAVTVGIALRKWRKRRQQRYQKIGDKFKENKQENIQEMEYDAFINYR